MHLKELKQHVTGHIKELSKIQYLKVKIRFPIYGYEAIRSSLMILTPYEFANIADDYFLSRRPVVNLRLAQGGVRLAATLNRIFGS